MNAVERMANRPDGQMDGCRLIKYTGSSMRYRPGSLLLVLPEIYAGQPLQIHQAYVIETRNQGRVYGRFLGIRTGSSWAVGQPCAIIAPDLAEFTPMEIPLVEFVAIARIVACFSLETEM